MEQEPTQQLKVDEVRLESEGVVSVSFVDPKGRDLPTWQPGAHLEIILPSGLVRQYSLWSNPEDPSRYRVGVLREVNGRGGSKEIHDTGLVGKTLTVNGPRNRFALVEAEKYIFIAGGIGVTPLIPMVHQVAASDKNPEWEFNYGGRSETSMAFTNLLKRLNENTGGNHLNLRAEDANGILDLKEILSRADEKTAIYCCGPNGLITAVENMCNEMGLPGLHVERFAAAPVDPAVKDAQEASNDSFEVELAKTGGTIEIGPEDTILEKVRAKVPGVPASCEEGFCGTCETRILDGEADHRDLILTQAEKDANETMFICVSRAKSDRLVLDL